MGLIGKSHQNKEHWGAVPSRICTAKKLHMGTTKKHGQMGFGWWMHMLEIVPYIDMHTVASCIPTTHGCTGSFA